MDYFKPRVRIVAGDVELCWICEKPLGPDGIDANHHSGDIVTVHTYCADARWGTDEQWSTAYRWCKAETEWREHHA